MDNKSQKERLEQELRFLKESFEAEVISKEEFEKGKDRIERKLKEIQNAAKPSEKLQAEPEKHETQEKTEQPVDAAIQSKEPERIKLKVIQDEPVEQHFEAEQRPAKESVPEKTIVEEQKKESKFFKYIIIFIVLILIVFFSYSYLKKEVPQEKANQVKFVAACSSDNDCRQEGKIGACISPNTKAAKCEFMEMPKTNVIVLNDRKSCFNCDTQRVLGILESWFGALMIKEIDYGTEQGKNLAEKFDAEMLPMYILEENITKNPDYGQFKQTFVKKNENYVLSDDAAGAAFYVKREDIQNRLDLLVKENDIASSDAEKNLKEFLENFNEAKFEKHLSTDSLAKELNIKTFPTFLINNKIKFSGVHAAETIKGNFCKLNKLPECGKSLSKSLV